MNSNWICVLFIFLLISCTRKPEEMTGATMGALNITADKNMKFIVEQEEEIFERNYKYARLEIAYENETEMFRQFLAGEVKVIMTYRPLTTGEAESLQHQNIVPRSYIFATGALAFVAKKNTTDSTYTYEEMLTLFGNENRGTVFVIEDDKSGITNEILRWTGADTLPGHFYALPGKEEVLAYVQSHDRAIGILDYSDISDSDLPYTREVLSSTCLLGISRPVDSLQFGFVKPYQYNLQDRKYPFTRDLYVISRTGMTDVGTGFAAFITGEIGQKIILKAGLLPKYQTERTLEINRTSDIKVVK